MAEISVWTGVVVAHEIKQIVLHGFGDGGGEVGGGGGGSIVRSREDEIFLNYVLEDFYHFGGKGQGVEADKGIPGRGNG